MFVAASAKRLWSAFRRVFPRCNTIAQAAAFNLFFAFFPALLIAVGFATTPIGGKTDLFPLIADFTRFLPPVSQQLLSGFRAQRSPGSWKVVAFGWSGAIFWRNAGHETPRRGHPPDLSGAGHGAISSAAVPRRRALADHVRTAGGRGGS